MRRIFAVAFFLVLALPLLPAHHAARQEPIKVIIHSSAKPLQPVKDARVVILSSDGKELTVAKTDARGTAFLRYQPGTRQPEFVLVEAIDCYISGLRWDAALTEYYILVTGRAAI